MDKNKEERGYRYETASFILRQVEIGDAPALLQCYSDPAAVALMNDDNCRRGFLCGTLEDMEAYISIWRGESYARPVVLDKKAGEAVGTVEIFGGETGVLRVDLRVDYEREDVLEELYRLALGAFVQDFPMGALVTKAVPAAAARRRVLEGLGFSGPEVFRGYGDYYRAPAQPFRRGLGLAICGLACCLCGESASCPGCQKDGCPGHGSCHNYACAKGRGVPGCWECPDFPCGEGMHQNPRIQAFARFAREHGPDKLLNCLERNQRAGVVYHYPGGLTGDYDRPTEEAVSQLIETGRWK